MAKNQLENVHVAGDLNVIGEVKGVKAIAMGRGAAPVVYEHSAQLSRVASEFKEVHEAIAKDGELSDFARRETDDIVSELEAHAAEDSPDKGVIRRLVGRLKEIAPEISVVAVKVLARLSIMQELN